MKVKIISHTAQPDKTIAAAAKLCYSRVGVEEINQNLTPDKTENFLEMLMSFSHASPLEHASFTFAVEGVSRTLTHQLVRHRLASYSQQSQRYVKLESFEYIIPPQIEQNEQAKAIFVEMMERDQQAYDRLTELLVEENAKKYMAQGIEEKKARRMAEKESIEDARYVFPNACETKIVITMNVRMLQHFFQMRCCNRAQWEIRQLATEMLRQVKEISPVLFRDCGPECVSGACPEGNMSCGQMAQVREKFKNL